jgi:hypothetical protein
LKISTSLCDQEEGQEEGSGFAAGRGLKISTRDIEAKITEEQLSAQDPSNIPKDWKTPGKYHQVCVAIWKAWLNFVQVFLDKQMIDGGQ